MAYVNATKTVTFSDRFNALKTELATRLEKRRKYRQTYNELSALEDRDLADLGISRYDLHRIATEASRKAA